MFKNLSLRDRFKLLLAPVLILTTILILFISYSEYKNSYMLTVLEKDIKITEDLRKLVSLISKEREISVKYISLSEARAKRIKRDLRKQRSINNTRFKSLNKKLATFSIESNKEKEFFIDVMTKSKELHKELLSIRKKIDNGFYSNSLALINSYTSVISNVIHLIASSSLEIENSTISKNIVIYSIFLKYTDILHQRDIFIEKSISAQSVSSENKLALLEIEAKKQVIIDIASSFITSQLLFQYQRVSKTSEIVTIENLNTNIIAQDMSEIIGLTSRKFIGDTHKYYQKLKELDDYISRDISQELNYRMDSNLTRVAYLKISFVIAILLILYITYLVYNNLREMLFFGTIKIRGSILRVMANIDIDSEKKSNNEIYSLIFLVRRFTRTIRITLFKMRNSFSEILFLSNHLAESSETIVNHVQKQSKYLENINLQLAIFLENLNNSKISFDNLKEIIEDSTLKLNNMNLDVIFISHEVVNIKELNKQVIRNKLKLKAQFNESIDVLNNSPEKQTDIISFMKDAIKLLDDEIVIIEAESIKLSNLHKTALTIKKEAEINNANLSDILGVITILGFETKDIASDINDSVENNSRLIDVSKTMVEKSKFLSSDTNILNNYIVQLDKEFNKFRF